MVEMVKIGKMIQTDKWPSTLCEQVGRLVIAHAQLCHQLYLAPKRIQKIGMEEYARTANPKLAVPTWCNKIKKDYMAKNGSVPDSLTKLLGDILVINEKRNDVIHAFWGVTKTIIDGQKKIVARHRFREDADLGVSWDEMRAMVKECRAARNRLGKFKWHSSTKDVAG
jgi:hypothetical protein